MTARIRAPQIRALFDLFPGEMVVDNFAGGGGASEGIEQAIGRPDRAVKVATEAKNAIGRALVNYRQLQRAAAKARPKPTHAPVSLPPKALQRAVEPAPPKHEPGSDSGLSRLELAIIAACAQQERQTLKQVCIVTGYSISSSGPGSAASRLRGLGFIEGDNTTGMTTTDAGREAYPGSIQELPTGRALLEHWCAQLSAIEAVILRNVVDAHPRAVSLAVAAKGYSMTSSGPGSAASKLRTLALVEGSNAGMVANERLVG